MSTAELSVKPDKVSVFRCAATFMEMLQREAGYHPFRNQLRLFSEEASIRDGATASMVRMPDNAVAVYVFREYEGDGPGHGLHHHDTFKVRGVRLMTIACFYEGDVGFMIRRHDGKRWETLEFPDAHLPEAIAMACKMLRGIK